MFFILANPRSGSSLLRLILNSHSNIVVPPECGFALWLYKKYAHVDFDNIKVIDNFIDNLFRTRKFETWNLNKNKVRNKLKKRRPRTYQETCNLVYTCYSNKEIIGDKNNYYVSMLNKLNYVFPNSKYVAIVRDGRDVACSYKEIQKKMINSDYAPKLPSHISDIANQWNKNNALIMTQIEKEGVLIRYEDLVSNPSKQLKLICNYLDVAFEPDMLNFYLNKQGAEPNEFLPWKYKTTQPISSESIKRYKVELSPREINEFNNYSAPLLSRLGYLD